MLCVLIVEGMSVVVNVMVSLISVMSPPPALYNLSVRLQWNQRRCVTGDGGKHNWREEGSGEEDRD